MQEEIKENVENIENVQPEVQEQTVNQEQPKGFFRKPKPNPEVEILKQQVADMQNKYMYAQAELINFKKRTDERIQDLLKYKNEDILLDLTDMIENLDRAAGVKVESEESKKIQVGINMVSMQFKEILKKYDVEELETMGCPFNSSYMEAMMIENNPDIPDEMVTAVLRKGYRYKDHILKYAQVRVNKNEIQEMKGNDNNE